MSLKPGMMPHHSETCDMDLRADARVSIDGPKPIRRYWCHTHNQWAYEFPTVVVYVFADGKEYTAERVEH